MWNGSFYPFCILCIFCIFQLSADIFVVFGLRAASSKRKCLWTELTRIFEFFKKPWFSPKPPIVSESLCIHRVERYSSMQLGSRFFDLHTFVTEVRGSMVFKCLYLLMPKVWISLKILSAPLATRNKAYAGLNGNPACEALVSRVTRRQQMNPVVGVAEAMMERRRRHRNSFSQVIQGESNEEEWRRKKPCACLGRGKRRAAGKLQYRKQQKGGWSKVGKT